MNYINQESSLYTLARKDHGKLSSLPLQFRYGTKTILYNILYEAMSLTIGSNCWMIEDDDNECVSWGSLFALTCVDNMDIETVALCHIQT